MRGKRKFTQAELRFVSENQKLSGFSGYISPETAAHEADLDDIARSAARFGAQLPDGIARAAMRKRIRIRRFSPAGAGLAVVRSLQEAEGGAWTADQVPAKPAISWTAEDGSKRYPRWQFRDGQLLPGIETVIHVLSSDDQWRVLRYFLGPREQLGGKRPLDLLREGKVAAVVAHARRHFESNTW